MDTGRTEKLSIAISVLFHAVVLAGLALGLGGTVAGPAHQYVSVELFESQGGAQAPPEGPKAQAAKTRQAPVHHTVQAMPTPSRMVKEQIHAAEEISQSDEPVAKQVDRDSSETPAVAPASSETQNMTLSDQDGMLLPAGAFESVMEEGGGEGDQGAGADKAAAHEFYLEEIRATIQSAVAYPLIARRRGLEANVLASFFVDESGAPHDVRVVQSSGFGFFDREVIRAIYASSPYPLEDMTLEVPVVFHLSDFASR